MGKIIAFTDLHYGGRDRFFKGGDSLYSSQSLRLLENIIDYAHRQDIDCILDGGDQVNHTNSLQKHFRRAAHVRNVISRFQGVYITALGNHDALSVSDPKSVVAGPGTVLPKTKKSEHKAQEAHIDYNDIKCTVPSFYGLGAKTGLIDPQLVPEVDVLTLCPTLKVAPKPHNGKKLQIIYAYDPLEISECVRQAQRSNLIVLSHFSLDKHRRTGTWQTPSLKRYDYIDNGESILTKLETHAAASGTNILCLSGHEHVYARHQYQAVECMVMPSLAEEDKENPSRPSGLFCEIETHQDRLSIIYRRLIMEQNRQYRVEEVSPEYLHLYQDPLPQMNKPAGACRNIEENMIYGREKPATQSSAFTPAGINMAPA